MAGRETLVFRGNEFATWLLGLIAKGAETGENTTIVEICQSAPQIVGLSSPTTGTLLHTAAATGNIEVMNTLLNLGADINSVQGIGVTPLKFAVVKQSFIGVHTLIQWGAPVGYPVIVDHGVIVDLDLINLIIANSPLMLSFAYTQHFNPIVVRVFVNYLYWTIQPNVPAIPSLANAVIGAGGTVVHAACWGDTELVEEIYRREGYGDFNGIGPGGRTAFYVAVETNNLALAHHLDQLGVNTQIGSDQDGTTTLIWACRHGTYPITWDILADGASIEERNQRAVLLEGDRVSSDRRRAWANHHSRHVRRRGLGPWLETDL